MAVICSNEENSTGIYHSGDFRIFLTDNEAELYKKSCFLFLKTFEILEDKDTSLVDGNTGCHTWLTTGIHAFDINYPPYLKKAVIKHYCDLLTNPESKLPTLGYDHDPLKVTAEALALAPLYWLAKEIKRHPDWLEETHVFPLLWQVAIDVDALDRKENHKYYGWSSAEEQTEFMESRYPTDLEDNDINKWQNLCYRVSDRLLKSYDSDWQMFFHKAEVYENYIKGTDLLPIEEINNLTKPMTQTTLEPQQTDSEDSVFIPSFSIKKLGRVLLGDHQNLPDSPGIYFAIDSANRVWYVGISTSSLRERHAKHEKLEDFKTNKVQHIAYFVWTDEQDLHEWELGYIQKFDPPLNMNHTKKDLPQIDLGYSEEHFISRYREIKDQIKLLEQEMEELKPNLVTLLEANGGKLADKSLGFSGYTQSRKTWQYSPDLEAKKEAIRELQKHEEETGIATVKSITTYPVFRFR
jgi:hypothetical protein